MREVQAQLRHPVVEGGVRRPQVLQHLKVQGAQVVKARRLHQDTGYLPQPGGEGLLHSAAIPHLNPVPRTDGALVRVLVGHGALAQGDRIDITFPRPLLQAGHQKLRPLHRRHPAGEAGLGRRQAGVLLVRRFPAGGQQAQKQEQGQPQQTGSSHGKFLLSTPRFIYNNG